MQQKSIMKISKMRSQFFYINKIDKPLARLMNKKDINNFRNERSNIATDSADNPDKMPNLNGCTGELF